MPHNRHSAFRPLLWLGIFVTIVSLACSALTPNTPEATAPPIVAVEPPSPTPVILASSPQIVSEEAVLVDMYARLNPSVVNISVYADSGGMTVLMGQGSGFVYDTLGNIVTNAHVVEGASQIEVTFYDGLVRKATLVGKDLHSDLAVVRVQLPPGVNPIPLGEMSELAVGQTVVAIGNPFGLEGTLTRGVISALGRTIPALTVFSIPQAIQTDAPINPGNSGGPLLNLQGEVIGVNAQIETGGTTNTNLGIGFAIPVSILQRVIPSLIETGAYAWSWLGVRGGDVTPTLVQAMGLPVERGAYLSNIEPGGPANQAGLRGATANITVEGRTVSAGGDIITAIDGQPVNTFDDLLIYITMNASPGDEVTLTVLRDGEYQDIRVTLQARP